MIYGYEYTDDIIIFIEYIINIEVSINKQYSSTSNAISIKKKYLVYFLTNACQQ